MSPNDSSSNSIISPQPRWTQSEIVRILTSSRLVVEEVVASTISPIIWRQNRLLGLISAINRWTSARIIIQAMKKWVFIKEMLNHSLPITQQSEKKPSTSWSTWKAVIAMETSRILSSRSQRFWNRTGFSVLQISGKESTSQSSNRICNLWIWKLWIGRTSRLTLFSRWSLMSRGRSIWLSLWLELVFF